MRLGSSVAKQPFMWRHWKRLTETFMIARGLSTFDWWCGFGELFYSPYPFLSLLIGKTKVTSHLFYTLKLVIIFFIALYLINFFFNLVINYLNAIYLFLFSFSNWILFLISPLSIWFQFIFISNLAYVLFIIICFVLNFLYYLFFLQFHP